MHVQVAHGLWIKVSTPKKVEYIPAHVMGEDVPVGKAWTEADDDFVDLIDGLRNYTTSWPEDITEVMVIEGYASRLIGGPSGFTTDWEVFATEAEAEAAFKEFFE